MNTSETQTAIDKLVGAINHHYSSTVDKLNTGDKIVFTKYFLEYVRVKKHPGIDPVYIEQERVTEKIHQHFKDRYHALQFETLTGLLSQNMCLGFLNLLTTNEARFLPKSGLDDDEMEGYLTLVELYLMQQQKINYLEPQTEASILELAPAKKLKRSKTDQWTSLSLEETVLFADFLRSAKVIISDDRMLSNVKLAEAFSQLTGFSSEAIRQGLSSIPASKVSKDKLQNIQKALHQVNSLIDRKLK